MRGIQTLYEIQRRSKEPGIISETKPVHIYTHYSADRTIILPNKERGFDFKYEITNEISVLAKYSGYVSRIWAWIDQLVIYSQR